MLKNNEEANKPPTAASNRTQSKTTTTTTTQAASSPKTSASAAVSKAASPKIAKVSPLSDRPALPAPAASTPTATTAPPLEEDISDEAILRRHENALAEERKKFAAYLKFPFGKTTSSRANRRIDSRADSSGTNTPTDPMSPALPRPLGAAAATGGGYAEVSSSLYSSLIQPCYVRLIRCDTMLPPTMTHEQLHPPTAGTALDSIAEQHATTATDAATKSDAPPIGE